MVQEVKKDVSFTAPSGKSAFEVQVTIPEFLDGARSEKGCAEREREIVAQLSPKLYMSMKTLSRA